MSPVLNGYYWYLIIQELQVMLATVLSNISFTFCKIHDIFNHIFLECHLHPHLWLSWLRILLSTEYKPVYELRYLTSPTRRKTYLDDDAEKVILNRTFFLINMDTLSLIYIKFTPHLSNVINLHLLIPVIGINIQNVATVWHKWSTTIFKG